MKVSEAINNLHTACEYYEMVHDTGNEKQTRKNKDTVWKGYNTVVKLLNKTNGGKRWEIE